MRYDDLYRIYNKKIMRKNSIFIIFTIIAISISMIISLVIPQVMNGKEKDVDNYITLTNNNDLKVEKLYDSQLFENKLKEYEKKGLEVSRVKISTTYIKKNNSSYIAQLLSNYDNIANDEAVISSSLAKSLNVDVDDEISFAGNDSETEQKYRIAKIETFPIEVNEQGELIGYIKVNHIPDYYISNSELILISGEDGETLKNELKEIENGYTYTTKLEQKDSVTKQISSQMSVLNIMSTMGYILAIIVIISSTILLVYISMRDLAIMRLISINKKVILRIMKLEINNIIFVPLVISCLVSLFISNYLLKKEGIHLPIITADIIFIVVKGIIINSLIFIIYRNIVLKIVSTIDALDVVNGKTSQLSLKRSAVVKSILMLPVSLFLYTNVMMNGNAFQSSFLIFMILILIYVGIALILKLILVLPVKKSVFLYTFKNIKHNKLTALISMLNLSMLIWFLLIGFNLGNVVKNSIDTSIANKLPYSYMVKSPDNREIGDILDKDEEVKAYSIATIYGAKIVNDAIDKKVVSMVTFDKNSYTAKFKIICGQDLFEGKAEDVLISNMYAEQYGYEVGNEIKISENDIERSYKIKGIYDCVKTNSNWILMEQNNMNDSNNNSSIIYLVAADNDSFTDELGKCYIANMNVLGIALLARIDDFLTVFKYICCLFIFASILSNLIILYIEYKKNEREFEIFRSIGKGKKFLYNYYILKSSIYLLICFAMSYILYNSIVKVALMLMFSSTVAMPAATIGVVIILLLVFIIFSMGSCIYSIYKKNDYNLLRDLV